ncbi:MAG: hypothetical protein LBP35_07260 [Candidatus Ancillula trichonymphae]|nr:hypothetical protein [Candidatus Ancillula trichonymphae]
MWRKTGSSAPKTATSSNSNSSSNSPQTRANPAKEVESSAVFRDKLKLNFNADLDNKKYSIVLDETAQIDGKHRDLSVTVRASRTDSEEDVSGGYNSYATSVTKQLANVNYKISYNENGAGLAKWYNDGVSHSLQLVSGASEKQLVELVETVQK